MPLPSTRLANPHAATPPAQAKGRNTAFLRRCHVPDASVFAGFARGRGSPGALANRPRPANARLMLHYLTSQSIWLSGVLIIGGETLLSVLGPVLVRRYVALDRLTINNEIAGFKFATVGVLYAVLLAFVIIVVWEKLSDAEVKVVREAGAAENLYRLSQGLGDYDGPDLRKAIATYVKAAIADDWPAMDKGTINVGGPRQASARRHLPHAL